MEELARLIEDYKKYAKRKKLKPYLHATHLALMISTLSKLSSNYTKSGDIGTDTFLSNVKSLSQLYRALEEYINEHNDISEPYMLPDMEYSQININLLVDLFVYLLIYIGGNDLQEPFMERLKEVILRDKEKTKINRFYNKRIQLSTRKKG
jgi:hypothetical protein